MPFTYEDFRAEAGLRIELRAFLSSSVGQLMLAAMRHRYRAYDVPNTSEALVSARILSQFHGANVCLDEIEDLAVPHGEAGQIESTYEAGETDHESMPSEGELRAVLRVPNPPENLS
jgi:hypothetical protein